MTTPLLLSTFNGSLAAQDRSGATTFTSDSAVSYVAGMVDSAFSAVSGNAVYIASPGHLNTQVGSLAMRIAVPALATNGVFFDEGTGTGGNDRIAVEKQGASSNLRMYAQTNGTGKSITFGTLPAAGTFCTFVVWWDGIDVGAVIDGVAGTPNTRPAPLGVAGTTVYIGSDSAKARQPDAAIDDVIIHDDVLSGSQQDAVFDTSQAWAWDILASAASRIFPVLKIGQSQRIGPLKVG